VLPNIFKDGGYEQKGEIARIVNKTYKNIIINRVTL
jgi:hypothetical protein